MSNRNISFLRVLFQMSVLFFLFKFNYWFIYQNEKNISIYMYIYIYYLIFVYQNWFVNTKILIIPHIIILVRSSTKKPLFYHLKLSCTFTLWKKKLSLSFIYLLSVIPHNFDHIYTQLVFKFKRIILKSFQCDQMFRWYRNKL